MDTRYLLALTSGLLLSGFSGSVVAQESAETPVAEQNGTAANAETAEATAETEGEKEETRTSANGTYEWKRSWGAGIQVGYWFQDLDRWNASIADDNKQTPYDVGGIWHFDLAVEASLLENTRISLFGGFESGFSDPSASAIYGGIEPAFAFRRDMWEVALGIGVGLGSLTSEFPSGASWDASLVLLRPFIEVRRYLSSWSAVYGRFGFNQWLISDPSFDNLLFTRQGARILMWVDLLSPWVCASVAILSTSSTSMTKTAMATVTTSTSVRKNRKTSTNLKMKMAVLRPITTTMASSMASINVLSSQKTKMVGWTKTDVLRPTMTATATAS